MKILKEIAIYFAITFISELISKILPIKVPASIIGIIILFTLLQTKILKLEQVDTVGEYLIKIMPILFVPAGVSLIKFLPELQAIALPLLCAVTISTAIVMVAVGKITELSMGDRKWLLELY